MVDNKKMLLSNGIYMVSFFLNILCYELREGQLLLFHDYIRFLHGKKSR
jgi:hypothetical protein